MAKKLCVVFAAIMTAITVILLSSCGVDPMRDVSERRSAYFTASDEAFTVSAVSGVREEPYALDGSVGELMPYTLITVVPAAFDIDALYTYTATTERGSYGGALVVHPFAASFSAEFRSETAAALTVTIAAGGETREYALVPLVTDDMITYAMAIEAAERECDIDGDREIRVRLIKNPISGDGLCWHVEFASQAGEECGVLLDARTARVIARKNSA